MFYKSFFSVCWFYSTQVSVKIVTKFFFCYSQAVCIECGTEVKSNEIITKYNIYTKLPTVNSIAQLESKLQQKILKDEIALAEDTNLGNHYSYKYTKDFFFWQKLITSFVGI